MANNKKVKREKIRYWLSYDLGLRGDYDTLYEWLDSKGSRECGDSIATFQSDRTTDEIRESLAELLGANTKARIYLISQGSGTFLLGKRKAAPWAGYYQAAGSNVSDR